MPSGDTQRVVGVYERALFNLCIPKNKTSLEHFCQLHVLFVDKRALKLNLKQIKRLKLHNTEIVLGLSPGESAKKSTINLTDGRIP